MSTSATEHPAPSTSSDKMCSCVITALTNVLPPYSPSSPAPDYSRRPATGERSLLHSPTVGFRQRNPESTFVKNFIKATVVLRGQEADVRTPWYGRDEVANGYISLNNPRRMTQVRILVEGKLDITMDEGVPKVITIVNSSMTLWKKDSASSRSCPERVEFAFSLPHTYDNGPSTHHLPPSFQVLDQDSQYLNVRCSYRIRFSITKSPLNRLGWEKTEHIFLPFDYLPRSRSRDPVALIPGCLANIKQLPNEWYQVSRPVSIESHPHLEPVTTNLFIPTARVYPITEPIPFHVQVSGRVDSLRALLSDSTSPPSLKNQKFLASMTGRNLPGAAPAKGKSTAQSSSCLQKSEPKTLRVFIIRQIRVQVNTKTQFKNLVIAEGALESVPPLINDCYCSPVTQDTAPGVQYLSWTGALKCRPEVKTGGFEGENLKVSDYVALVIGKEEEEGMPTWMDVRSSVGIKLVTDSWEDPPEVQIEI